MRNGKIGSVNWKSPGNSSRTLGLKRLIAVLFAVTSLPDRGNAVEKI